MDFMKNYEQRFHGYCNCTDTKRGEYIQTAQFPDAYINKKSSPFCFIIMHYFVLIIYHINSQQFTKNLCFQCGKKYKLVKWELIVL